LTVERERDRPSRSRIEPLGIINGQQQRAATGHARKECGQCRSDSARLEVAGAGVLAQGGNLQGPALRWWKVGKRPVGYVPKEVRETHIGQTRVGRAWTAYEHGPASEASLVDSNRPQRRLADARLAFDEKRDPVRDGGIQPGPGPLQLDGPSDDIHPQSLDTKS
jgi:hypothetical protein